MFSDKSGSEVSNMYRKTTLERTDYGDSRGRTFKLSLGSEKVYSIVEIKKSKFRGGHFHSVETPHIVLGGRIRFEFVNPKSVDECKTEAFPMEIIWVQAGIAHLLEGLEDSLFLEPVIPLSSTTNFESQRKRVIS